ncbi:MAG: hypothetical protein QOJ99_730, partial [Bryobacterales bacterium]|nr:hypothetical protein [Bryobacterales bacterium]
MGALATPGGLVTFMRVQLGKPIPSPIVLGQVSEKFREAVKAQAEREQIPVYQFQHKERKDDIANAFRRERDVRDQIVFVGRRAGEGEGVQRHEGQWTVPVQRDKTVYVNHYYFYIDDASSGLCLSRSAAMRRGGSNFASMATSGQNGDWKSAASNTRRSTTDSSPALNLTNCSRSATRWGRPEHIERLFRKWLKCIPLPLRPEDRRDGYDWDLSLWQMEVSLTRIFDRPLRGREFFE